LDTIEPVVRLANYMGQFLFMLYMGNRGWVLCDFLLSGNIGAMAGGFLDDEAKYQTLLI